MDQPIQVNTTNMIGMLELLHLQIALEAKLNTGYM